MINADVNTRKTESGNAAIIVLVALVIVAVGGLAYLSGKMTTDEQVAEATTPAATETASGEAAVEAAEEAAPPIVIEQGNPVVAKLDGQDITRLDIFNFIQTLPPNVRQLPVDQLFPLAVNEVVNARILEKKVSKVNLDRDPQVKEQLAAAKANIVRNVFVQKEVDKKVTDERLKQAYEAYKASFPVVEEANAQHILVDEEKLAKDLVKQLNDGAEFAALAKEHSKDGTSSNGGDLGYFTKAEVVPEFAEAAFSLNNGEYTPKPVKSEFGYHVIKLNEKRTRPPAEFEQAKPFLEGQLRQAVVAEVVSGWRKDAKIEVFDINGKPVEAAQEKTEPAAGAAE